MNMSEKRIDLNHATARHTQALWSHWLVKCVRVCCVLSVWMTKMVALKVRECDTL